MANTYLSVSTGATWLAEIQAALTAKYGAGNITYHYAATTSIIFTCSLLSTKVIKLFRTNTSSGIILSYGDAWTSGTTITNEVVISKAGATGLTAIHFIMGDAFIAHFNVAGATFSASAYIGLLTSGDAIAFGTGVSASYDGVGYNITTGAPIIPVTFERAFNNAAGALYKQALMFRTSAGVLLLNADTTPANLAGLECVSYAQGTTSILKVATYLMAFSGHKMNSGTWDILTTSPFMAL